MNTRMLRDPMLYIASILESFLFGFIESFVGIFNFNLSPREVFIIVLMSVVGIFFSLFFYALLSDEENHIRHDIQRDTRQRMLQRGYRLPPSGGVKNKKQSSGNQKK